MANKFVKLINKNSLEEITITENGEYTPSGDGYSKVTVEVESGGTTAIISNGKAITIETATVTEDGENTISIGG